MSFSKKTWNNKGTSPKTPINKAGLDNLEQRIFNAFQGECEIGVMDTGVYLKYDNGVLIYLGNVKMPAINEAWTPVDVTITLPVPYKDTQYFCDLSFMGANQGFASRAVCFTRNTGSIRIRNHNNSSSTKLDEVTASYFTFGFWK